MTLCKENNFQTIPESLRQPLSHLVSIAIVIAIATADMLTK